MPHNLDATLYPQQVVLKVTGLTAGTLQNWANRRIVKLSVQNPGRQARRLYSPLDMMKLLTVAELSRFGVSAAKAAEFAETVVLAEADRQARDCERMKQGDYSGELGNACHATFYFDEGELKCDVTTSAKKAMFLAILHGAKNTLVKMEVNVSNIVYVVKQRLLMIEMDDCDAIIAEHERG